jgi:hypothetical protein
MSPHGDTTLLSIRRPFGAAPLATTALLHYIE